MILDAFPSKRFRGQVFEILPRIDRAKATGTVKVKMLEGTDVVLPGMSARVNFFSRPLQPGELGAPPKKIIPADAVAERGERKVAFALENGRAREIPLVLGGAAAGGFELKEGPSPGVSLVRSPPSTLTNGQPSRRSDEPSVPSNPRVRAPSGPGAPSGGGGGGGGGYPPPAAQQPAMAPPQAAQMGQMPPVISLRGVSKFYSRGGETLRVLENMSFDVPSGAFEALMGPSGSGKSTLLNLLAGLDRPTNGALMIAGARLDEMTTRTSPRAGEDHRLHFPVYNLMPVLTAVENVELRSS